MLYVKKILILWSGIIVGTAILLGGLFATVTLAASTLVGPVYPPPGGFNVTFSGIIGGTGGMDVIYTDFDSSQFDALYWGPTDGNAIELALDGTVDSSLEILSFDAAQSDLANGIARWTGQADLTHFVGGSQSTVLVQTRFTIMPSDLGGPLPMELASSLGITDSGAVLPVTDDYQVKLLAEIYWSSSLAACERCV